MSENLPEKKQKTLSDRLKFKKCKGTTDLGKLYENDIPVFVILKLLQNKKVKDFRISTNDDQFGNFDDFILEVDYINKPTEKYAVQLKHKEKSTTLGKDKLEKSKDFGVMNYAKACQKIPTDYKVILFTNAKFRDTNDVIDLGNPGESIKVRLTKCEPSSVINTSEDGESYQFQFEPENSEEIKQEYNDFFGRFFLYTNQMSAFELHDEIQHSLDMLTSKHAVSLQFLEFISDWNIKLGIKFKLTKDMIVKVLTLRYVEELIHPHTFCEVNDKKKILQKAISQFNITAFNNTSLDQVVKIWGDGKSLLRGYDIKRINEILKQFQIGTTYIKDIDDLTDEESTKLLWVMDNCPLILKDGPAAYEAAKLCAEKSKFVFITDNLQYEKLQELTVFKTLFDLKRHKQPYNDIVENFTFKLLGESTSFAKIIEENDDFENIITTNEIAQITDPVDIIKLEEEKLCFPYIERHLYKNIIDFKYLQNHDEKTMVVISSVTDVKKLRNGLQNFEIVSITDELHEDTDDRNSKKKSQISSATFSKKYKQYSNKTNRREELDGPFERDFQNFGEGLQSDTNITKDKKVNQGGFSTKHKLVFNETETSPKEFTSLCNKNKKYQRFHHLRYYDEYLEWIESTAGVSDLHNFSTRSDSFVNDEEKYVENISHNVNIVIGDPGMGKSLFLKKLKNNLLSKYLPVIILPTDVPQLYQFINHRTNIQKFFDFILETKFLKYKNFERQVLKLLMQQRKVVFLWDALDELSEGNRKFVQELIKTLSRNSIVQFVTSRGFLRKQLEDKFNLLSQELQPFNDIQQTDYIQRRLQDICSDEELGTITASIKENIAETSYSDILGIPLQIYMLTELFRHDRRKYKKLLCEFFVVTDLYFHFIEGKFDVYLEMKKKYPPTYKEDLFIMGSLSLRKKSYQMAALKSIFGTTFSIKPDEKFDSFLKEIKENGDAFGLITAIDMNMNPEFLHNSYAEYFAANYLAENYKKIPNLDLIFDRRYTNVKYFFDLLLAKNSPAHIAVLCKNVKSLRDCSTEELKSKDLQGRNALHLAASWGERYPLLETSEISNDLIFGPSILINDNINYETKEENTKYYEIMEVLLENCDLNEVDELFKFTPTMYAEKCECLFAAAIIGKKNKSYLETKNDKFIYSLLYYAIKYKFIDIVNLFVNLKFVIMKNENSFLHLAVANNHHEHLRQLLKHEAYRRNIDYRNSGGDTALLTAAGNGYAEIVKYLKEQNAQVDAADEDDFTPLMWAAANGHLDTVKYLIQRDANVNASAANDGWTPLYGAAQNGHLEIVKYLKQQNANVNAVDKYGWTPLYAAALNGHLEIVKYLKQQNANVNAVDNYGWTPLYAAALNGHLEIVKYLKQQNAKVDAVTTNGTTPFYAAALNGHLEIVKYLKQQNAQIDAADNEGVTPLMVAAGNGDLHTVKYLIQQDANVNAAANYGWTPLNAAVLNGHLEIVKYLKQQNAKVDVETTDGTTPLMWAAANGHLDTVKYLIQQDANVNAAANDGCTPLYAAARNGHLEIVKYLKQQNAKVDAAATNGTTPLYAAAKNGHLEIVKYLKQQNAKVDTATMKGNTPLIAAAENGYLDTVKYLIQQSANVNGAANDGGTPLYVAAENGHLETVKYLKQQNAKVDAAATIGTTAFYAAAENGHLEIVKYLKQQNAKVDAAATDGTTPLYAAARNGHLEIVKYLKQQNAKVDAAATNGTTPLYAAARNGHLEIVKYLKQQNAKVDAAATNGTTPLMWAAANGHLDTVKYLIQQNANVNAVDNDEWTPLHHGAKNGELEIVKYLMQHNAKVDTPTEKGFTPLMIAAQHGHLDTLKYLIQQNADVHATSNRGETLLMTAAWNGHIDTVKYLIQQNASVNAAADEGQTPLYFAALNGHLEIIKYLEEQNAKVDIALKNGTTALMSAAENGHLNTVKYLIQQNANVNASNIFDETPLMSAAGNGHLDTVKYLLDQNANVNADNDEGQTPLYLAALNGHLETVKYLKRHNAKVDVAASNGTTPLMVAAENGHLDTVKYLVRLNAHVNAANDEGQTPLYLAALNGYLETVKYLKRHKAKVDVAASNGTTPLMIAAENGHLDTVKYLAQQKANVNATANNGTTPLIMAAKNGHLDTVEYLIQKNANVDAVDNEGQTPLYLAAFNEHFETVEFLNHQTAKLSSLKIVCSFITNIIVLITIIMNIILFTMNDHVEGQSKVILILFLLMVMVPMARKCRRKWLIVSKSYQ